MARVHAARCASIDDSEVVTVASPSTPEQFAAEYAPNMSVPIRSTNTNDEYRVNQPYE